MKITVSFTNKLLTEHRVRKVCDTLANNGYEVLLAASKKNLKNDCEGYSYKTHRMNLFFKDSFLFYIEYNIRLFFYLVASKTDAFLANDTDTLPANFFASFIRRKPLIFDAHVVFPETPRIKGNFLAKWFWILTENIFFPHLETAYSVCQSIADHYNTKYGINMRVVRTIPVPDKANIHERPIKDLGKRVIIYQGEVCEGRELEHVIDALPMLKNCVFYIIGDGELTKFLKSKVEKMGLTDRVIFTGWIPSDKIRAYTRCAHLGINLLENRSLNHFYSLSIRFFEYLQANVPSLSSNFPEIRKIFAQYDKLGLLTDSCEPAFLAVVIEKMLQYRWPTTGFDKANKDLTWQNETSKLLNILNTALNKDDISR